MPNLTIINLFVDFYTLRQKVNKWKIYEWYIWNNYPHPFKKQNLEFNFLISWCH